MSDATISVRFFAQLREQLDTDELTLPATENLTVANILELLAQRGGHWSRLADDATGTVMAAVNQQMVKPDATVTAGDEVAFFPPVTGG